MKIEFFYVKKNSPSYRNLLDEANEFFSQAPRTLSATKLIHLYVDQMVLEKADEPYFIRDSADLGLDGEYDKMPIAEYTNEAGLSSIMEQIYINKFKPVSSCIDGQVMLITQSILEEMVNAIWPEAPSLKYGDYRNDIVDSEAFMDLVNTIQEHLDEDSLVFFEAHSFSMRD